MSVSKSSPVTVPTCRSDFVVLLNFPTAPPMNIHIDDDIKVRSGASLETLGMTGS